MRKRMKFYAFWLSIICIFMFLLQVLIPGFTEALILNSQAYTQPWRFVSAIFLHGDLMHLVYNLFALLFFGLILEKFIGSLKFIVIFLLTGIVANIVAVFFYPASLGASGAIFGIIGTLTMIKPFMIIWAFGLPLPLIIAAILWVAGDIFRTFMPSSNIGTIAHLSGMGLGLLIGFFLRSKIKERKRSYAERRVRIPESYVRDWEDNWMR